MTKATNKGLLQNVTIPRQRVVVTAILLLVARCLFDEVTAFTTPFVQPSVRSLDANRISNFHRYRSLYSSSDTAVGTKQKSAQNKMGINGAKPQQSKFPSQFSINISNALDRIRKVSNIASLLCVLDCTILPIITVALPLLGVLNFESFRLESFPELGHSLALYFVLPVGSLTTLLNYFSHRKTWISTMAALGLMLVGLANSHFHPQVAPWGHLLHMVHHGPWHGVVNISGCVLLLGSNYLSQQQGCAHHGHSSDSHNHDCGSHTNPLISESSTSSQKYSHDDHNHQETEGTRDDELEEGLSAFE